MTTTSLTALAQEHLIAARSAPSGRSAHTVHGGHDHVLRQTLIALLGGQQLAHHESPGNATLQVLLGQVHLTTEDDADAIECTPGDIVDLPPARHGLDAIEDSVVLLTVAQPI